MNKEDIAGWLLEKTLHINSAEDLICELAKKLDSLVKVNRISLDIHTVHPEVFVQNLIWKKDIGVETKLLTHDQIKSQLFIESPVAKIYKGSDTIRMRINNQGSLYPLNEELAAQGCTDYIIFPMEYTRGGRSYISYTTGQKGGFTGREIEVLEHIRSALSRRLEIEFCHFSTKSLLQIYLRKLASARGLHGKFAHNTRKNIEVAIWLCNLGSYTRTAMNYEEQQSTTALDLFFELVADTITRYNGSMLKFIDNSMLVIFEDHDKKLACKRALNSSLAILKRLQGESGCGIEVGMAIHIGKVVFDSVSNPGRLDFTVDDKEVNYTSSIESYCKTLNIPIVLSNKFVETAGLEEVEYIGKHSPDNALYPVPLYTISTKEISPKKTA